MYIFANHRQTLSTAVLLQPPLPVPLLGLPLSKFCAVNFCQQSLFAQYTRKKIVELMWLSGATWRNKSGLTLAQVMACRLTAPSHYLHQCWHTINGVLWIHLRSISDKLLMNLHVKIWGAHILVVLGTVDEPLASCMVFHFNVYCLQWLFLNSIGIIKRIFHQFLAFICVFIHIPSFGN